MGACALISLKKSKYRLSGNAVLFSARYIAIYRICHSESVKFDKRTGTLISKRMRLCKIPNRYIHFTKQDVRFYQIVKVSISLLANI